MRSIDRGGRSGHRRRGVAAFLAFGFAAWAVFAIPALAAPSPSPSPYVWPSASAMPSPGVPIGLGAVLTPLTGQSTGAGSAVLTISGDRTSVTWHVAYSGVAAPVTMVAFCAGGPPRTFPIDTVCAFAIDPGAGGPSPIVGSAKIVQSQIETLASGYAVIQLLSGSTPLLGGYLEVGVAPSPSVPAGSVVASESVVASAPGGSVTSAGPSMAETDALAAASPGTASLPVVIVVLAIVAGSALASLVTRRRASRSS